MSAQPAVQVASASNTLPPVAANSQTLPAQAAQTAAPTGPIHVITAGESLYYIARKYGVSPDVIVQANNIKAMDNIYIGQTLIIPGGKAPTESLQTASIPSTTTKPATAPTQAPKAAATTTTTATTAPAQTNLATAAPAETAPSAAKPVASDGKFRWPLSGTVITDFATSRSGINIAAAEGTAVRAAESGTVIYTGSAVQGYGNLVLIKHDNGYVSAYAHLKDITVAKGEVVNRGDAIGSTGMTGGVARPQLHFELRKGATPVDPTPLLAG